MLSKSSMGQPTSTSFLPEDYLEKRAERRTNFLALTLFSVVITSVVGAFFVTNRQWSGVRTQQEMINIRYTQAAKDIEQLEQLEEQKERMIAKAEITTALIEKAPRSVLLAELINRMPEELWLLEFELRSKRIDDVASPRARRTQRATRDARAEKDAEEEEPPAPQPPKFLTTLSMVGVAPSHNEVSNYLASLQDSTLLWSVELVYSEFTMVDNRDLSKFRITAALEPDADARSVQPLAEQGRGAFGPGPAPPDEEPAPPDADQRAGASDEEEG